MIVRNLYSPAHGDPGRELFETLIENAAFRLERIRSTGQATPPGQWYDQQSDEWVVLLAGEAGLVFEQEAEEIVLRPGDYIHIPAHARHRVAWTSKSAETIWLALHFRNDPACGNVAGRE